MREYMASRLGQALPVLVGLGAGCEPGLTPLDLPGRAFRVQKVWRSGISPLVVGRLGVFVSVTCYYNFEFETCLRFARGHGFFLQEDLLQVLRSIQLSTLGLNR
jgi:hypothetical protein